MIITKARKVRTTEPSRFAWGALRTFQNMELVTSRLVEIHKVPAKYRDNVRKQAQQLRYCMIQAREYFAAAHSVSTATKPNLLYYGAMSLALAEILFKQSGQSSLDKARDENRHHGLSMTAGSIPKHSDLRTSAGLLRATPLDINNRRRGTFELWHSSSREHPLAGHQIRYLQDGGSTKGFEIIFGAFDHAYPQLPKSGITLADCLAGLPLMAEHVVPAGLTSTLTRGMCESSFWFGSEWRSVNSCIFHPSGLNESLFNSLKVNPNNIDRVVVREAGSGLRIDLHNDWVNGGVGLPLPPAATVDADEWRMWTNTPSLNEFGYFYVALHIAGNYARYFPVKWLHDVEQSTPLALAIEELCTLSEWRIPWLALCELDQTLYVNEA